MILKINLVSKIFRNASTISFTLNYISFKKQKASDFKLGYNAYLVKV